MCLLCSATKRTGNGYGFGTGSRNSQRPTTNGHRERERERIRKRPDACATCHGGRLQQCAKCVSSATCSRFGTRDYVNMGRRRLSILGMTLAIASCAQGEDTSQHSTRRSVPGADREAAVSAVIGRVRMTLGADAAASVANGRGRITMGVDALAVHSTEPREGTARLADIALPLNATREVRLADRSTGVAISFHVSGTTAATASIGDGVVVYPKALEGGDLIHRATGEGIEDFVFWEERPAREALEYRVALANGVAGLRLVADTLEFLDSGGVPRLRMAAPYVISLDQRGDVERSLARVSISGCTVDSDTADPRDREPVAPGSPVCVVTISWGGVGLRYPALVDPAWTTTGSMSKNRHAPLTQLLNGRVLASGGGGTYPAGDATCEIFDLASSSWAMSASMLASRAGHTATLLADGRVLVVAGGQSATTATAEMMIPTGKAPAWKSAGTLAYPRFEHTATLLEDGTVLVAGGDSALAAERFDPAAIGNPWSSAGLQLVVRNRPSAVRVPDGRVLLIGGRVGSFGTATAEIYHPKDNTWAPAGSMWIARGQLDATFSAGKVLVVSGNTLNVDAFDPLTMKWSLTGALPTTSTWVQLVPLPSLAYQIDPSAASAYDASAGKWWSIKPPPPLPSQAQNTALADGRALFAGGKAGMVANSNAAFLFDPSGPDLFIGAPCESANHCKSGACVDGVCCDSPCSGVCQACSAALKGQGVDGVCDFVKGGLDLKAECATIGAGDCQGDGVCNGAGTCASPTSGNVCAAGTCADSSTQNNASICNASGICESGGTSPCHPYVCSGSACLTSCASTSDCAAGTHCVGGQCLELSAPGESCAGPDECTTNFCVEGVCCDGPCAGVCESCLAANKVTGLNGLCGPRKAGESCGEASCSSAHVAASSACDGLGNCATTQENCSPFSCADGVCVDECGDLAPCVAPHECVEKVCVLPGIGDAGDAGDPDDAGDAGVGDSGGSGGLDGPRGSDASNADSGAGGNDGEEPGCSCRVAGKRRSLFPSLLCGTVALVFALRRRRRVQAMANGFEYDFPRA
jgi:hypothetical protein